MRGTFIATEARTGPASCEFLHYMAENAAGWLK